jgi:hypothetical protein
MNETYGVKGSVHKLEQRRQSNFPTTNLTQKPNPDSFDVEFSPAGRILKRTDYSFGNEVYRFTRFEYDDAGRLIRTVESNAGDTPVAISELVYSEGKCVWTSRDGSGVVTNRGVDEYVGERLTLSSTNHPDGKPKLLKSFEYSEGKLSQSVSKYYGQSGELSHLWVASYDSSGRVAKTFGLKADGSPLGDGKYKYEYDAEDRRTRVWSFIDSEDDANAVTMSEYLFDESGNWIERSDSRRSKADSNWTKSITTRRLTYYAAGKSS